MGLDTAITTVVAVMIAGLRIPLSSLGQLAAFIQQRIRDVDRRPENSASHVKAPVCRAKNGRGLDSAWSPPSRDWTTPHPANHGGALTRKLIAAQQI
jgi:hypothetical protein